MVASVSDALILQAAKTVFTSYTGKTSKLTLLTAKSLSLLHQSQATALTLHSPQMLLSKCHSEKLNEL